MGSGFYTVNDYKDILRYANDRHIEIIPEIDMPGNMHAGIKAMEARFRKYMQQGNKAAAEEYLLTDFADTTEYLSTLSTDNSINVCMDSTITFIRYVIKAIKRMHEGIQPLKEYHFGGTRHWQNQHFFHRSRKRRGGGSEEKLRLLWKWGGLMLF